MKTKLFIGLFALAGLLFFNISIENSKGSKDTLALQNVGLMQANASEMWCDQSIKSTCTITTSGGTVGTSIGKLRYEN